VVKKLPTQTPSESVNLIVLATGKREQFSNEVFEPSGALWKTDRSARKCGIKGTSFGTPASFAIRSK